MSNRIEEKDSKKSNSNEKEVTFKESNETAKDSMQSLEDIFIKNTKLIKDSIKKSIASNILPVIFFLNTKFNFN
jgi:hypothetical protein